MALLAGGCASFGSAAPEFSPTPSLTGNIATVEPAGPSGVGGPNPSGTQQPGSGASSPGGSTGARPDPCAVPPLPAVAVCLDAPWGIAPLPDGDTALVGERVSGRILSVTVGHEPVEVATIGDLDTSAGGGLLGLALSPYYQEDRLIYAYVTTAVDARVLRLAAGQEPKAVVTGLPVGGVSPGGAIAFGSDGLLYVVTGSGPGTDSDVAPSVTSAAPPPASASPGMTSEPRSSTPATTAPSPSASPGMTSEPPSSTRTAEDDAPLAIFTSAILRFDTSGKPAGANSSGSALFARGFRAPTGLCAVPGADIGLVDHRHTGDLLLAIRDGGDYTTPTSADTLWTYSPGDGGAFDCTISDNALMATARSKPKVVRLEMRPAGGFTGAPEALLDDEFGQLRSVTTGPGELVWLVTANRASAQSLGGVPGTSPHHAGPSDDQLLVLPPGGGDGGGGGID